MSPEPAMVTLLLLACRDPEGPTRHSASTPLGDSGGTVVEPSDSADSADSATSTPDPLRYVFADPGNAQGCALVSDGSLRCWGNEPSWLERVPGPDVALEQLSITGTNKCGVTASGMVGCWCLGSYGEICGHEPNGEFVRVEAATDAACAQRTDGTLKCWSGYPTPNGVRDEAPTEPVGDFDVDVNIGCAVRLEGSLTCWGSTQLFSPYNEEDGDFGLGEAPPLDLVYTDVAVGARFGCALAVDGEIHCWGIEISTLASFPDAPPGPFTQVAGSGTEACGIHVDGTVECWGTTQEPLDPPPPDVQSQAPEGPFSTVALGGKAACGVRPDGELVCWGEDPYRLFTKLPTP